MRTWWLNQLANYPKTWPTYIPKESGDMAVPTGIEPVRLDRQSSIIPVDHGTVKWKRDREIEPEKSGL